MKRILYIFIMLIICHQAFADNQANVLVLPFQTNLQNKDHKIYQQSITKMVISQLILQDIKTTNFNNSEKILNILKKKNISKSDLANLKIIDNLDYILIGKFKKYNNEISLLIQLINANTGTTLFEDKQQIELNTSQSSEIFIKNGSQVKLEQDHILQFFTNSSEQKQAWSDFSIVEKAIHFIKLNSFLSEAQKYLINSNLSEELNQLDTIIQQGRFSLYSWNKYLDIIRKLKDYDLPEPLKENYKKTLLTLNLLKKKQIDLMFVMNSSSSMKDEILTLKKNIKQIMEHFHSINLDAEFRLSITDFKNKKAKYRVRQLPFTQNMQKIENYLTEISKETRDYKNPDLLHALNFAVSKSDWSQHLHDKKIVFLLTDKPYSNEKKIFQSNNLLVLPFTNYTDINNQSRNVQKLLIEKIKLSRQAIELDHGAHEYINLMGYNPKKERRTIKALQKKYQVQYYIEGEIIKKQYGYKLIARLKSSSDHKVLKSLSKNFEEYSLLNHALNMLSRDIVQFFNAQKQFKFYQNNNGEDNKSLDNIIETASKKNIKVFVLGCSGLDKSTETLLSEELANKTRGQFVNIQYRYPALLSSHDVIQFLYLDRELFRIVKNKNSYTQKDKNNYTILRDISLGKVIQSVELSKQYLLAEGFPIDPRFGFQNSHVTNNLALTIKKIVDCNISDIKSNFTELKVEFGSYHLNLLANLSDKEKRIAKGLIKSNKEVIFAVNIIPTELYKLKQKQLKQKNNFLPIAKILKYKFHPVNMKIITPKWKQYIPEFLITNLEDINQNPYYYHNVGFTQNKVWFIRGTIKNIN